MIEFLHTFIPKAVLIDFLGVKIYFYGLFIVAGILAAVLVAFWLAEHYAIKKNDIIDLAFWLIIAGIAGARVYHVLLELPYYLKNPWAIFAVWQGGLAIHGAIITGLFVLLYFSKKYGYGFWKFTAIIVPGLSLAQAIGRFGNYFNQEVYGYPTDLPWGIPIEPANRIAEFYNSSFFHPVFLYESCLDLIIFTVLFSMHWAIIKKHKDIKFQYFVITYLFAYSLVRFLLEFIRVDTTPEVFGLRWPQVISIAIMVVCYIYALKLKKKERNSLTIAKN